jgi:DNA repair protein RecO (recombination protein O)
MRILLQPAYILHGRAYRDTSLLLDVFTQEYGRLSLVARGVRAGKMRLRSILQPFIPLLLSIQGQSELKTLISAEVAGTVLQLRGDCLLSGFYLNELLIRSIQKEDAHPELFFFYKNTLNTFQGKIVPEKCLRLFELKLLSELGYAIQLKQDCMGNPIELDALYLFYPDQGFKLNPDPHLGGFKGRYLLDIASEQFEYIETLAVAKRVTRFALATFLGISDVASRKLFKEPQVSLD